MSTNKVYGDKPNILNLIELETRYDYSDIEYQNGIPETFSIDNSTHSIFGASKVAADIMVQEYGRYFSIPTMCLRGGCLTGENHSGVELHGFLNYLVKCNANEIKYNVFGYKGKQVRDNIHSSDVIQFMDLFIANPRIAEVYNIGGKYTCKVKDTLDYLLSKSTIKNIEIITDKNRLRPIDADLQVPDTTKLDNNDAVPCKIEVLDTNNILLIVK